MNHRIILAAALTAAVVCSAGNVLAASKKTIAVIPKGTASMWWEVVHKGAQQACEEEGYECVWSGPEQETDRERQIQCVEDAITKDVAAIVLGPNDFNALVRPVKKIKKAGIPCVIIDSAVNAPESMYEAFAATDNLAGGATAADIIGKKLGGKGKVMLVKFVQNSASTDARADGFKKQLADKYPGIEIATEQYTMGTVEDARQKTVDMLSRDNTIDAVFAVNQPTSVGAFKALQNEKMAGKVAFVAFDSDPVLLNGVENNEVEAIIAQNPYAIGYDGVKAAVKAIKGIAQEKNQNVASMVVTIDNLDEMKEKFPAALGL